MRALELVTEMLRGAALTLAGGFLFACGVVSLGSARAGSLGVLETIMNALLLAGTAVYFLRWVILSAGAMLGLVVHLWAERARTRRAALIRGALAGSPVGLGATLAAVQLLGGASQTEEIISLGAPGVVAAAALFAGICAGLYSLARSDVEADGSAAGEPQPRSAP